MIRWRITVNFLPGKLEEGIAAVKKIVDHLEKNLGWPEVRIYRGFIGIEENRCEVETFFASLSAFEKAWQRWGKSPQSRELTDTYHQLIDWEKIDILQSID